MDGWIDTFIGFIERNQTWLPLIMLVFAAAETTAFLSILIPSTAVLVAVGALAATGAVPFWPLPPAHWRCCQPATACLSAAMPAAAIPPPPRNR